jgi:hypothetical protein
MHLVTSFFLFSGLVLTQEYYYKTGIRVANDIRIEFEFSIDDFITDADTIVISTFDIKGYKGHPIRKHFIFRRQFERFISGYPNPWTENNIVFEIADSTDVSLFVLDEKKKIYIDIFEKNLGKGFYTIKPSYIFNTLPSGNYYYNLHVDSEDIIKNLVINRKIQ